MNMGKEGSTNQNVASACAAMFAASGLSRHSQIIPRTETSGSDAINPPKLGYRFATSEITAVRIRKVLL